MKTPNIIFTRESVDQQLIEMIGRVVVFCDYEIALNQNLVQDVQGLSLPYALKIAGPPNFCYHFG